MILKAMMTDEEIIGGEARDKKSARGLLYHEGGDTGSILPLLQWLWFGAPEWLLKRTLTHGSQIIKRFNG